MTKGVWDFCQSTDQQNLCFPQFWAELPCFVHINYLLQFLIYLYPGTMGFILSPFPLHCVDSFESHSSHLFANFSSFLIYIAPKCNEQLSYGPFFPHYFQDFNSCARIHFIVTILKTMIFIMFWWKQKTLKIILEFFFIFFFKWDPTIFFLWLTSRLAERCLKLWDFVPWTNFFSFPKQTKKPKNTLGKTKPKNKNVKKNPKTTIKKDNYLLIQRNKGIFKC